MKYRPSGIGPMGVLLALVAVGMFFIWIQDGNVSAGLLGVILVYFSFDGIHFEIQRYKLYKEEYENKRKNVLDSLNTDVNSKIWFSPDLQSFPVTGIEGKIYYDEETHRVYVWNKIRYVEIALRVEIPEVTKPYTYW